MMIPMAPMNPDRITLSQTSNRTASNIRIMASAITAFHCLTVRTSFLRLALDIARLESSRVSLGLVLVLYLLIVSDSFHLDRRWLSFGLMSLLAHVLMPTSGAMAFFGHVAIPAVHEVMDQVEDGNAGNQNQDNQYDDSLCIHSSSPFSLAGD